MVVGRLRGGPDDLEGRCLVTLCSGPLRLRRRGAGDPGRRTRLEQPDLPVRQRPLDVHRLLPQRLGPQRQLRNGDDRRIVQRGLPPLLNRHGLAWVVGRGAGMSSFVTNTPAHDPRPVPLHDERVRLNQPVYHRGAQPPGRIEHDAITLPADRVHRKGHAGHLRRYQALHDHGHRGARLGEAVLVTIGHGGRIVERRPAAPHPPQHLLHATDPGARRVEAGKRRVRQVFERGGGADGDRRLARAARSDQAFVGRRNGADQRRRQRPSVGAIPPVGRDGSGRAAMRRSGDDEPRRHAQAVAHQPAASPPPCSR